MKKKVPAWAAAVVAGGSVLTTAALAHAASIDCTNAANVPNPVYVDGASTALPLLEALATYLGNTVSIIYNSKSTSCLGVNNLTQPAQEVLAGFSYISPTGTVYSCTGAPLSGGGNATYPAINPDIAVSDVYPTSCITPSVTLTSSQKDFHGAIQPIEIVVPYASTAFSISADAAYVVFAWAGQDNYVVQPWTDPTAIWTRGDTSGTQILVADAIGLNAAKWLTGLSADAGALQIIGGSAMPGAVINGGVQKPDSTIGILGTGTADPDRGALGTNDAGTSIGGLKPLAFQAAGQECGYYPDSQLSTFDKINVRQGRYAIWGPTHWITNVDSSGNPLATTATPANPLPSSNASVAALVSAFTHNGLSTTTTPTLKQAIEAEAKAHLVPDCAMQVSRSLEVSTTSSGEASYQPTGACGCYFESVTGGGTTLSSYCQTCNTDSDCADAGVYTHCNFGYCEAQ
jgi:hypothetical protein